jgi:hypothetical protein
LTDKSKLDSCPECGLFLWACKCKEPIETRIPTEKEIRKYTDCKELGLIGNDAFIGGFQAGWVAHKDHLKDFLNAQTVVSKEAKL